MSVVTTNLVLRGQPNKKLRDIQLGPFIVEEHIGKHNYILRLRATTLTPCFHVNNLRPCSTASLRPAVPLTVLEGDDEEFDVSHISDVCINSLHGRRGKYLLVMTHFSDDDIPLVWHRLPNKFAKTQAYIDLMHAHPTRIHESQ
jgi:hypothetical protein